MGPDVENERTTKPERAASALSAGLERERFEAWARPDAVQRPRHPETGDYLDYGMAAAWAAWQAATIYERAACEKICKDYSDRLLTMSHHDAPRAGVAAYECGEEIAERSNV